MRPRTFALCAMLFSLGTQSVALPALAADKAQTDRADRLFRAGREAMRRKDFANACANFYQSQALDPAAGTLLNLAECEAAQGRGHYVASWKHVQAALSQLSEDDERLTLARQISSRLERRLAKLRVVFSGSDYEQLGLECDGVEVPSAQLGEPIIVESGHHVLVAKTSSDRRGKPVELRVAAGESRGVVVPSPPVERARASAAPQASSSPGDTQRGVGYAGLVIGGVALGVATYFALHGNAIKGDADQLCSPSAVDCPQQALADTQRSQADLERRVAIVTSVTGALVGAAGLVLVLTADEGAPKDKKRSASLSLQPGVGGAPSGVWLTGRF